LDDDNKGIQTVNKPESLIPKDSLLEQAVEDAWKIAFKVKFGDVFGNLATR